MIKRPGNYKLRISSDLHSDYSAIIATTDPMQATTISIAAMLARQADKYPKLPAIIFEFDKYGLSALNHDTLATILKVLSRFPDALISVTSHTDSRGSEVYNLKLSQKRAETITRYLTSAGIEKNRIISRGAGEKEPVTLESAIAKEGLQLSGGTALTESFIDSLKDSLHKDFAHSLNRRTELVINNKSDQ